MSPKVLENIVILCFEMRFSKQNSVIRLKSNILTPQNFYSSTWWRFVLFCLLTESYEIINLSIMLDFITTCIYLSSVLRY